MSIPEYFSTAKKEASATELQRSEESTLISIEDADSR
jgi:hypothetical protein